MKKEKINNLKITLSFVALCLPLFAKYSVTAQNGCPYETYVRIDGKCLDISQEGLNDIIEELDSNSVEIKDVNQEVKELNQDLNELSKELKELCVTEHPQETSKIKIMENVCQY